MPLEPLRLSVSDPGLLEFYGTAEFWSDYFWITEGQRRYSLLTEAYVDLPVGDTSSFVLGLDSSLSCHTLYLRDPRLRELTQLGWSDQAHFHPDVLRWVEMRAVVGAVPMSVKRGALTLLLLHFAPPTEADDLSAGQAEIRRAWEDLGLEEGELLQRVLTFAEKSREVRWVRHSSLGWVAEGEDAYSLRHAENAEFPHAVLKDVLEKLETA